jgi:hypothetical protein
MSSLILADGDGGNSLRVLTAGRREQATRMLGSSASMLMILA